MIHITLLFLTAVLCLSVVLQILGDPLTFWDLTDSDDTFTTSVMTGLTVISAAMAMAPLVEQLVSLVLPPSNYHYLGQQSLFRPPLF